MRFRRLRDLCKVLADSNGFGGTVDLINEEIRNAENMLNAETPEISEASEADDVQPTPVPAPRRTRKTKIEKNEGTE
jgi:hypothetical protein